MSEWGPWIEHDGKGCPCRGQFVHIVFKRDRGFFIGGGQGSGLGKREWIGITNPSYGHGSWDWNSGFNPVIRYRIRKPRALLDLIEMVENLPAPVGPKVPA